jgi:hypothetical protein
LLCVGVTAFAVLALASPAGAAEFPKGTYTASNQKDWSIQFGDKGKFTVMSAGKTVVEGSYEVADDQITLTDEKGPFAAKDDDSKTGKYKWKLEGKSLTFSKVADKSTGRELLLTMNTWEPQK